MERWLRLFRHPLFANGFIISLLLTFGCILIVIGSLSRWSYAYDYRGYLELLLLMPNYSPSWGLSQGEIHTAIAAAFNLLLYGTLLLAPLSFGLSHLANLVSNRTSPNTHTIRQTLASDGIYSYAWSYGIAAAIGILGTIVLLGEMGVVDALLKVIFLGAPTLLVCHSLAPKGATPELGKATFVLNSATDTGPSHPILLGHDLAGKPINYRGEQHLLTVGATRSGKGVGAVIPNSARYRGSLLAIDPKGEALAVGRRGAAGNRTIVHFAPLSPDLGPSASLNLLQFVRVAQDRHAAASVVAECIIHRGEDRSQFFWEEEAASLLIGLLFHFAAQPDGSLRALRDLVFADETEMRTQLAALSEGASPTIKNAFTRYLNKAPNERSGVLTTLRQNLGFLDNEAILSSMDGEPFRFARMFDARTSVFIVLPPQFLTTYGRWLRLIVGIALFDLLNSGKRGGEEVLFIVDEMAALGRMRVLQDAFALLAGYGVRVWGILQDLSQLKATYGDAWETFIGNSGVFQAFSARDFFTAEYISKRIGNTTARPKAFSPGGEREEVLAFPLLAPEEVSTLEETIGIVFVANSRPIKFKKIGFGQTLESA